MVNDDCSTRDSRMKFVDTVEGYFKEKENLPLPPNGLGTSIVAINGAADPARVSAVLISFSACAAIQHKNQNACQAAQTGIWRFTRDTASMWWWRAFNYDRLCRGASLLYCSRVPDRETLSTNRAWKMEIAVKRLKGV